MARKKREDPWLNEEIEEIRIDPAMVRQELKIHC